MSVQIKFTVLPDVSFNWICLFVVHASSNQNKSELKFAECYQKRTHRTWVTTLNERELFVVQDDDIDDASGRRRVRLVATLLRMDIAKLWHWQSNANTRRTWTLTFEMQRSAMSHWIKLENCSIAFFGKLSQGIFECLICCGIWWLTPESMCNVFTFELSTQSDHSVSNDCYYSMHPSLTETNTRSWSTAKCLRTNSKLYSA